MTRPSAARVFRGKILALTLLGIMSLFPMVRQAVASLLLILVASPFTAPFETCDVATLFGSPTTLAPVQVQFAWTVDEDSHAVAPGAAALRRVRMGLKLLSHVAAGTTSVTARHQPHELRRSWGPSIVSPAPSPPSHGPLRI